MWIGMAMFASAQKDCLRFDSDGGGGGGLLYLHHYYHMGHDGSDSPTITITTR